MNKRPTTARGAGEHGERVARALRRKSARDARVRWVREELRPTEQKLALRAIVALLLEIPIGAADREQALAPSHLKQVPLAQLDEPTTYRPAPGLVPPLPPIAVRTRSFRERSVRESQRRKVNEVKSTEHSTGDVRSAALDAAAGGLERSGSWPILRPGTGGRQAPLSAYTLTTATADFYEEFGDPTISRHGDAVMQVWVIDPEGDGGIGVRLSSRDVQNGETAMGQAHPALALSRERGLKPRLLVVTTENSGGLAYDQRCDFELIEREIFAGRCRWVWYRDVKRLIRNVSPFYRFRDLLIETGTDLWLTDYAHRGGPINWDSDDIQLGIEAIIAERERKSIYSQMHTPLMTRWLGEGRGWPGAMRFGFRRNPLTKFPEVDPEQWPFVRIAMETYIANEDGKGNGARAVVATLAAAHCPLSESSVKRLLGDLIYVTGEYTVRRAGVLYECRPIELPDPIPADLFARVQELRKLRRGKETRNPAGFYPLNGIIEHECGCRLRARSRGRREIICYEHYSPLGAPAPEACRGWSVVARDLERAVIREVRRLAKCAELQEEWTAIARPRFAESAPILDGTQREAILAELARLTEARDRLEADFVMKVGKGEERGDVLMSFHKLTGGLSEQIKALQHRLAQAEVLDNVRRSTRPPEKDPLLTVLLDLLTEEAPDDPQLVRKRAAFLKTVLSKVVVFDRDNGSIEIELHGPLVPADVPPVRPMSPLVVTRDQLLGVVAGGEVERDRPANARAVKAERDTSGDLVQPGGKGYLTGRLDHKTLPKLKRPGSRIRVGGHRAMQGAKTVAPAWVSSRLVTSARRHQRGT